MIAGYTILQWLTFFMIYSFFGWIFESTYCSIKEHRLLNRGFCHGPWIPLYGTGAVFMLFITHPYTAHPVLVYISGFIGATLLELVTGYAMYHIFKIRWWDYSNAPLNLGGYICLGASIAWGFLSVLLTEALQPMIFRFVQSWSYQLNVWIDAVFYVVFTADSISSFFAAWDIRTRLIALSKIKLEMTELIASIDDLTDEAKAALMKQAGELKTALRDQAIEFKTSTGELKESLQTKAAETLTQLLRENRTGYKAGDVSDHDRLSEKGKLLVSEDVIRRLTALQKMRAGITDRMSWWSATMLRNNPTASSALGGFSDLKNYLKKKGLAFRTKIEDLLGDFAEDMRHEDE